MWANNETGQLLPVKEVGELLSQHQAVFHVDATQVMGKFQFTLLKLAPISYLLLLINFMDQKVSASLYYNELLHFDALIHGGEQEEKDGWYRKSSLTGWSN